jgi:hypothetical protein
MKQLKDHKKTAQYMQGLLLVSSLMMTYTLAIDDNYRYSSLVGFVAFAGILVYFGYFIYVMVRNRFNGLGLSLNTKGAKDFKVRKRAGEDSETMVGDEFSRALNYKAAAKSWHQTMFFMWSLVVMSFVYRYTAHQDSPVGLIEKLDGFQMLFIIFSYMTLLLPVKLYELSQNNDPSAKITSMGKKGAATLLDRFL